MIWFWLGFWTATAWWTWVLAFYEPKPLPPRQSGNGNYVDRMPRIRNGP